MDTHSESDRRPPPCNFVHFPNMKPMLKLCAATSSEGVVSVEKGLNLRTGLFWVKKLLVKSAEGTVNQTF